jgi:predicted ATPase/DNA-binding winged helix-turn-helix (wHTH) protein
VDEVALGKLAEARASELLSFGPFELARSERLLTKQGVPVELGARALDILIMLVERGPEIVGKRDLLAEVWPDTIVDESSLRFQIATLRKALSDGDGGARYVTTVPGRGYCFVAPLSRRRVAEQERLPQPTTLPSGIPHMVGRDDDVQALAAKLGQCRFVTILGPGGIGKTTVAVKTGHALLEDFDGAVHFVDLGPVGDPRLVPAAIASALGLLVVSDDPAAALVAFLHDKRTLLILDGCEHVIGETAALTETLFARAPSVHILATSRETLRAAGETVYQLAPLQTPSAGIEPGAAEALGFSAVQLFVDRAQASDAGFALTDAEAPVVAEICRRLDGMALAIELAASRVHAYGVRHTALLLNGQIELRWQGRRTAPPRHQTLNATLDWSYELLPEAERAILRRLSVFAGPFDFPAALAIAGNDDQDGAASPDGFLELVNKSLVSTCRQTDIPYYRLLDTTRAYAGAKLLACGESDAIARRHAAYFLNFLERARRELSGFSRAESSRDRRGYLGNIRAALEWSFGPQGDLQLGTALAGAAADLFLQLSLLTECRRWAEQALAALDAAAQGTRRELILQASLGQALMFTHSNSEQVRVALLRALALAEALESLPHQLQLLGSLHLFHERIGDYQAALAAAERSLVVATQLGDKGGIAAAHSFLGISRHFMGNHDEAHEHLSAALSDAEIHGGVHFGFDQRNRARVAMARNLFLRGRPDQASRLARETVDHAAKLEHPLTLCMALIWGVGVHVWAGDLDTAAEHIERFIDHAQRHSLGPYLAVGAGVQGELSIRRGDAGAGVSALRDAIESLQADHYELLSTPFLGVLAEGLAALGRSGEALEAFREAIERSRRQGRMFILPDLLRARAETLAALSDQRGAEAELFRALQMSRSHGARAWELRAATGLARLWTQQGRPDAARNLLGPVYGRFTEGFATADLRTARLLLADLSPA